MVKAMFKKAWEVQYMQTSAKRKIAEADKNIAHIMDRIMESSNATVIRKYKERIENLEKEKLVLREKLENQAKPKGAFGELFELSLTSLAKPYKLWDFRAFEVKRTVLKLAFKERVVYCGK